MKKQQLRFLKRLVETPSATGSEERVAELVRARFSEVADWVETDTMGSVHATLDGQGSGPTLMLSAHMDEVGLMVTYISDEGFLSVAAIGGVDAAILPGMRMDIHAAGATIRGVVGRKPIHLIEPDDRKSITPLDKLVIDTGLSPDEVKSRIHVGDPITYGVGFERFGHGLAVSRGFDDKVGVFVTCRVMEELATAGRSKGDFTAAITVQEEIGTRGAITSAHSIDPDVALAFDVTHATDYPGIDKTKYGDIKLGAGPVIARGPNINPVVFERLVAAAEAESIPYQLEAEPGVTGTDARAIQVARDGIPTGLISIPLRYMHTPTEVISLSDIQHAVRLIARFALDMEEEPHFVPGIDGTAPRSFLRAEGDPYIPKNASDDNELDALLVALEQEEALEQAAHDDLLHDDPLEVEEPEHSVEYTAEMKELIARTEEAKQQTQERMAANAHATMPAQASTSPTSIPDMGGIHEVETGNTGALMPEDNILRPRF